MPGSHSSTGEYPAVHEYSTVRGDAQEQKRADDFRQARKPEVQIRKQTFLVQGILCRCDGKNAKKIQEYIANQLQSDLEYDQMTLKEYIDPFTGELVKRNK